MSTRLPHLLLAAAAAAVLAGAAAAATVPGPPAITVSIDSSHLVSDHALAVAGTMTCSKNAHFHLSAWAAEADRGALGKGSIPPKLPANLSAKKAKAAVVHWRTATTCSGTASPWTLTLAAVGAHSSGFAAGTAHVCLIAYAGKSHLYTLFQTCADVTVS